jgi:hypothetical protein
VTITKKTSIVKTDEEKQKEVKSILNNAKFLNWFLITFIIIYALLVCINLFLTFKK